MTAPSVAPVAPGYQPTESSPDMSGASGALNLQTDRHQHWVANSDVCAPSTRTRDLLNTNAETPSTTPLRNQVSFLQSAGPPPPPTHISWTQREIQLTHALLSKYTFTPGELAQQGVVSNMLDLLEPSMEGFGLCSGLGWVWTSASAGGESAWPSAMVLSCAIFEGTVRAVCLLDVWTREVIYEAHVRVEAEGSSNPKPQSLDYVRANLARFITADTYLVGPDVCAVLHALRIAHPRVVRMPDPSVVARLDRELSYLQGSEVHGRTYEPFSINSRARSVDLAEEACEWARVLKIGRAHV